MLVQWEGLLPEETSWKDWDQLKSAYHLEDKVILQVTMDVTKKEQKGGLKERPNRKSTKLGYLKDYL